MTSELKGLKGYTDGYIFDENENCIGKTYNRDHAKIIADAFERDRNTRAVPGVPELVRYEPHDIEYANEAYLVEHPDGEYVRYSEAAAVIERYKKDSGAAIAAMVRNNERAEAAEAELAQIKAQEPVGYTTQSSLDYFITEVTSHLNIKEQKEGDFTVPLYAAPVDQTAEIERLRGLLKRSHAALELDRSGRHQLIKEEISRALGNKSERPSKN